jgi:hypothetical protein
MERKYTHRPYPPRRQERAYLRDSDLQLEIPEQPVQGAQENRDTLHKLLDYYHKKAPLPVEKSSVKAALHEAESSFQFMMKIRQELSNACRDLLKII